MVEDFLTGIKLRENKQQIPLHKYAMKQTQIVFLLRADLHVESLTAEIHKI